MGPVLRAPGLDLLDQVTTTVDRAGEAGRIVDAGTLAIEAVRRRPRVAVVGIDVPGSMLSTATTSRGPRPNGSGRSRPESWRRGREPLRAGRVHRIPFSSRPARSARNTAACAPSATR